MKNKVIFIFSAIVLGFVMLSSCKKQDEYYKEWYEIANSYVYPQCIENFTARSGYCRVELSWLKPVDLSVEKAIIYWHSGKDSIVVDMKNPPVVVDDTIKVSIPLEENSYTFDAYTFDVDDNKSMLSETTANVIGESFAETLSDRTIKSIARSDNNVVISWNTRTKDLSCSEVRYKSTSGSKTVTVNPMETSTTITDYDFASPEPVQYRSLFKSKSCLDIIPKTWIDAGIVK